MQQCLYIKQWLYKKQGELLQNCRPYLNLRVLFQSIILETYL